MPLKTAVRCAARSVAVDTDNRVVDAGSEVDTLAFEARRRTSRGQARSKPA